MSTELDARAEIAKLARLLTADEERFAALVAVPAADLRTLRDQITDVLYDSDAAGLRRAAGASRHMPGAISAAVAQHALGPVLCARIAGLVDTHSAVDVAKRLPIPFLADVSAAMDPRRASHVIAAIPADHVVQVAAELARRGEHVTMGNFVGHLDDATISASFAVLSDADLLQTGFVMDDKGRLDGVIALLPPERLHGVIAAAHEHDLWTEALDLFDHLSAERRLLLAEVIAAQDDDAVAGLLRTVAAENLWDVLVPMVLELGEEARARVVALAGEQAPPELLGAG